MPGRSGMSEVATASVAQAPRPRSARSTERRAALLFISPWLIGLCVFVLYPVGYTVYLSFTDYDVINNPTFVGTENYSWIAGDDKVRLAMRNTAIFTLMSVPAQ